MPFRSKPSQLVFCKSPGTMPLRSEPSHFFMQITWQMAFNSETSEFLFQISCPKPLRSEPLQNQYEVYISILFNNHVIPRVVLFTWHSVKYLCWWPGILKSCAAFKQLFIYWAALFWFGYYRLASMKGICFVAFSYCIHFGSANLTSSCTIMIVRLPTNLKVTTLHTCEPNSLAIICVQTVMQKCLAVPTTH